ncbi:MAG TPA: MarR family transcriptional regulator [Spirochaetota bacterium]|jgi:DNA-binding MarR family transcriptional regulator|nr:MarR family transcriptional regulator [Spirochaetota bacterium]HPV39876.1 MarR family transcriptional regulator [Spirochaetota bacterium]
MDNNDEYLKLDNQLCFVLYAGSRAITRLYTPLLKKLGITYPQYLVLLVLWEEDGLGVSAIGSRLRLDTGTLTPLLKRMESQGLLSRRRTVSDERKVAVYLTARGKKLKEKAAAVPRELFCRTGLTAEEFLHLKESITVLIGRMERDQSDVECKEDSSS